MQFLYARYFFLVSDNNNIQTIRTKGISDSFIPREVLKPNTLSEHLFLCGPTNNIHTMLNVDVAVSATDYAED